MDSTRVKAAYRYETTLASIAPRVDSTAPGTAFDRPGVSVPANSAPRRHGCGLRARQLGKRERVKALHNVHCDTRYARLKRGLDISACLFAAPVVLPLAMFCALAVRISSPGPILFRQQRTGQGGRAIEMLKFRSMVADAEAQKATLKKDAGIDGPDFKLTRDPRITRVGALMRKTSLDELPQLWNVFRGDMSLVGPRPTSFGVDTYQAWHAERLEVKPGLTGLWQIKARGDLDFDYRVRLDIDYVRHRSLLLDLRILIFTVPCVLSQRGAY